MQRIVPYNLKHLVNTPEMYVIENAAHNSKFMYS